MKDDFRRMVDCRAAKIGTRNKPLARRIARRVLKHKFNNKISKVGGMTE